jgi:ankyrin repeat protein
VTQVVFKVHNNPNGFALAPSNVPSKPVTNTRVHFPPAECLFDAAALGNAEEVDRLLDDGLNPNSRNADGLTALHK